MSQGVVTVRLLLQRDQERHHNKEYIVVQQVAQLMQILGGCDNLCVVINEKRHIHVLHVCIHIRHSGCRSVIGSWDTEINDPID